MENKPQETGTVKWYNDAKGYGFIISDSDSANVYAEKWNISNDPKTMFELQRVEFDRVQTDNGLKAININVLHLEEHKLLEFPRISVFDNMLSADFCKRLIHKHSTTGMNPNSGYQSRVESHAQVTEQVENRGISLGVDPYDYDILATAIVQSARIPYSHIEAIDVYNYETGQFLAYHHDYPYDPRQINYYKHGGDRVGTGIFYLNNDFVGGETYFPKHDVTIYPKVGSFLYFEQGYDEATNWSTIHESKKITAGTKWIASCFFSDRPRVGWSSRDHLYDNK
jgi:prolyl 4-hydroxylase